MYRIGAATEAADCLWSAIALRLSRRGVKGLPERLEHPDDLHALWCDPSLLLAQTCGYPLVTSLRDRVHVVATPVYRAPGCDGSSYRSAIIVRNTARWSHLAELRGSVCAVNGLDSNSGMNLLRSTLAPLAQGRAFFRRVDVTGCHAASLRAVSDGQADVAAIDCISFALLERSATDIWKRVRVVGWTGLAPGLPLITARASNPALIAQLRAALADVAINPALSGACETMLLERFIVLPEQAYESILAIEDEAAAAAYPTLR